MPDKHSLTLEEQKEMVTEMRQMEHEPLLPIEKKLITYSILLGLVLLLFFVWVSQTYFSDVPH